MVLDIGPAWLDWVPLMVFVVGIGLTQAAGQDCEADAGSPEVH